jgi:hypothetical protein
MEEELLLAEQQGRGFSAVQNETLSPVWNEF